MEMIRVNKRFKYNISLNGFCIEYKDQLKLHTRATRIFQKLPKNINAEIEFSKKNETYDAKIKVDSPTFMCEIVANASSFSDARDKIFIHLDELIQDWKRKPEKNNILAPYFGGYPSFYARQELTA